MASFYGVTVVLELALGDSALVILIQVVVV